MKALKSKPFVHLHNFDFNQCFHKISLIYTIISANHKSLNLDQFIRRNVVNIISASIILLYINKVLIQVRGILIIDRQIRIFQILSFRIFCDLDFKSLRLELNFEKTEIIFMKEPILLEKSLISWTCFYSKLIEFWSSGL